MSELFDVKSTIGRWPSILSNLGVDAKTLSKRNCECPWCGGTDRFRFTDQDGAGVWICNQCGSGNGFHFVQKWFTEDFRAACKRIAEVLPQAAVVQIKEVDRRGKLNAIWSAAHRIEEGDAVALYLASRALEIPQTGEIRCHEGVPYFHEGKQTGLHPAMVCRIRDLQGRPKSLHVTYLDFEGNKADVQVQRKVLAKTGEGPSIRIIPPTNGVLAIAEGVETALSVEQHWARPVWSLLSAGAMTQFQPPPGVTHLEIWGDNDASFTGQHAAYSLANRLFQNRKDIDVKVRIPKGVDADWNDVHRAQNLTTLD